MKFRNLIGLIIVFAISSKIHCAPIEQEKSDDQIEVSKFYQKYFGKPQYYSELPKKYALDFIPEVSKQEPSRLYQEHFGNPQYSKLPETYALEFSGPKEPNTDIEAAQFYKKFFENPQFSKLSEKYALEVGGPKEPNIDIEAAQFYIKFFGNPGKYTKLPEKNADKKVAHAKLYLKFFGNPQFSKLPEKYALEVGPKEPNVNIEVSQLYKKVYGNPQLYSELPQQYALDFIPEESETEKNYNKPK